MKAILVCGARPNFMKIAPLLRAIDKHNAASQGNLIEPTLVHTGQHYDYEMSQAFFQDLELPKPDIYLENAKRLNISPAECVVIEDSDNGVEAAKTAGMKCIGYRPEDSAQKLSGADLIIEFQFTEDTTNKRTG